MRNFLSVVLLSFLLPFFSCSGKSKLIEAAERKAHDDSIQKATEAIVTQRLERKRALEDSITIYSESKTALNELLKKVTIEIEVQKDNLTQIKGFKWLRTQDEREQQIRAQMEVIQNYEQRLNELRNQIMQTELGVDRFKQELSNLNTN